MYERALAFNPRYPDALYNLGVACGEAGLSDRAIFAYEMAAQLNPSCAEVPHVPSFSAAASFPAKTLPNRQGTIFAYEMAAQLNPSCAEVRRRPCPCSCEVAPLRRACC